MGAAGGAWGSRARHVPGPVGGPKALGAPWEPYGLKDGRHGRLGTFSGISDKGGS